MKVVNLLLFFLIIVSLIFSGCINEEMLGEESHPVITNIDVMSTPDDDETFDLRVTVYLQNPMDSDTGSLSVRIKTRDSYTNLITAEHTENVGYLKAGSRSYRTLSFSVPNGGEQLVVAELLEDNNLVDDLVTKVRLIEDSSEPVSSVILTDLVIQTIQATNYGKDIIFEASPGLHNQGEEATKVTVIVTAIADEYTRYTGSNVAYLESGQRTRPTVRMTIPADQPYTFGVDVIIDGEIVSSAHTGAALKLHEMKLETPGTHKLIGSGSPITEERPVEEPAQESERADSPPEPGPGFEITVFVLSVLCAAFIMRKKRKRS
ncbi:hypothetical protein [Methanolobus sp. WCC5]|uniref:DUF7490 domain-containing protein n=1 Tax=Methanolobus sp. WCC5 TaxID=3125785 RepID=UPI00325661B8